MKLAAPMQRHGNDRIESFLSRKRGDEQVRQRSRHRLDASVFEQVDHFPQLAFVESVAIGRVKTTKAAAAQSAAAFVIEDESVLERRPATRAEKLCAERLRFLEAPPAHGNSPGFAERRAANA